MKGTVTADDLWPLVSKLSPQEQVRIASRIPRAAVRARCDAAVSRRLDELFADEPLRKDQARGARDLDAVGTDWTDERW